MSRFTNDTFEESSKTTIGVAFATKNMAVETSTDSTKDCKKQVKLQVWDTGTPLLHHHSPSKISSASPISRFFTSAGQERYRALSSAYAILAQGPCVHVVPVANDAGSPGTTVEPRVLWLSTISRLGSHWTLFPNGLRYARTRRNACTPNANQHLTAMSASSPHRRSTSTALRTLLSRS